MKTKSKFVPQSMTTPSKVVTDIWFNIICHYRRYHHHLHHHRRHPKVLKDFTSKVNDLFVSLLSTPPIYTPVTTKGSSSSSSSSLLSPSPLLASEVLVNSSSIIWQYLRRGEAPPGGRWRSIPIYLPVSSQQPNSLIIVIRQKIFNVTCGGKIYLGRKYCGDIIYSETFPSHHVQRHWIITCKHFSHRSPKSFLFCRLKVGNIALKESLSQVARKYFNCSFGTLAGHWQGENFDKVLYQKTNLLIIWKSWSTNLSNETDGLK